MLPDVRYELLCIFDALACTLFSVVWSTVTIHIAFADKSSLATLMQNVRQDFGRLEMESAIPDSRICQLRQVRTAEYRPAAGSSACLRVRPVRVREEAGSPEAMLRATTDSYVRCA